MTRPVNGTAVTSGGPPTPTPRLLRPVSRCVALVLVSCSPGPQGHVCERRGMKQALSKAHLNKKTPGVPPELSVCDLHSAKGNHGAGDSEFVRTCESHCTSCHETRTPGEHFHCNLGRVAEGLGDQDNPLFSGIILSKPPFGSFVKTRGLA